jgi:hypothetical protein
MQAAILGPQLTVGDDELAIATVPRAFSDAAHACPHYRISIHHEHFWNRMRELAAFRYPLLRQLLGDAEFDALVRGYIAAHPPASFTGGAIVAEVGAFLARHPPWGEQPILADLAALDFRRSSLKLCREEAPASADALIHIDSEALARMTFRLKARSTLTTTHYRFRPAAIREVPRDAKLDEQPTCWLVYLAQRACITQPVSPRIHAALSYLAAGTTLAGLFRGMASIGFARAEIEAFLDRCLRAELIVAEA